MRKRFVFAQLVDNLLPIFAVILALIIGAVILLILGASPVEAYTAMFSGAFANKNGLADTLVKSDPPDVGRPWYRYRLSGQSH